MVKGLKFEGRIATFLDGNGTQEAWVLEIDRLY